MSRNKNNLNINEILIRVGKEIGSQKNVEIAKELGVNAQACSNWKSRGSIPWTELFLFSEKNGVSLNYLLTGKDVIHHSSKWMISFKAKDEYPFFERIIAEINEAADAGISGDDLLDALISILDGKLKMLKARLKKLNVVNHI